MLFSRTGADHAAHSRAGNAVAKLITACGFVPVSVDGIDQSLRIEAFGDLHEYGALGKLVSAKEAEAVLGRGPDTHLKSEWGHHMARRRPPDRFAWNAHFSVAKLRQI